MDFAITNVWTNIKIEPQHTFNVKIWMLNYYHSFKSSFLK